MEFNDLGVISELVKSLKEKPTVFILGVLLVLIGTVQRYFKFELTLAIGIAVVAVYGPLVLFDFIKGRRNKQITYDDAKIAETMRKAQDALDRSGKR